MTEPRVAGAFGAAERIDLGQYKHAIQGAPELLYHLSALVIPGRYVDGQPTATDLQAAPGRLAPLDAIDAVFVWLWREAGYWAPLSALDTEPIGHMVRRDDDLKPIGPVGVMTRGRDRDRMVGWAHRLVAIILRAWPTIEVHLGRPELWGAMEARAWASDADEALLRPLAQWPLTMREPVPERPRRCPVCGEGGIFTQQVETSTGVVTCARCAAVVEREAWMTYEHAAEQLGVSVRTIQAWVAAGVPSRRKQGSLQREVELGAARMERDMRAARRAMNLPQTAPPPC